jgi:hypothetical protein
MTKPEPALVSGASPRSGKKYFTLSDARRALPLVKRIAADIQATQTDRFRLHGELSALAADLAGERIHELQDLLDKQTTRLENLIDELSKIGVDLKDPARALLDFPAIHEGREIMLCWKGGEETITSWHEVDTGYAGRRPVEELHDQPV